MPSFKDTIAFARKNPERTGKIIEPRFWFDSYTTLGNTDPAAFTNGEQFPVRLTHIVTSIPPFILSDETGTGLFLPNLNSCQGATMHTRYHDEFYQSDIPLRLSSWSNTQIAPPTPYVNTVATHRFAQPVVLKERDHLRVVFGNRFGWSQIGNPLDPEAPIAALPFDALVTESEFIPFNNPTYEEAYYPIGPWVSFTGVGMESGRPYFFGGQAMFAQTSGVDAQTDTATISPIWTVDPTLLTNAGGEAVALTEMTVSLPGLPVKGDDAAGRFYALYDLRLWDVQVRQVGSGTQADWFSGAQHPVLVPRMRCSLLGTDLNSEVVHKLPGEGITLNPAQTLRVYGDPGTMQVRTQQLAADVPIPAAEVAFAGYIMVT